SDFSIKFNQKVNLKILTQASVAILLEEPHMAHRHESILLNKYRDKLFQDHHSYEPYYIAAEVYLAFQQLFQDNIIDKNTYKTYENHLMMIYKILIANKMPNISNQKLIDKYCSELRVKVTDINNDRETMQKVIKVFNNTTRRWENELKKSRFGIKDNVEFTQLILSEIAKFLELPDKYTEVESSRAGLVLSLRKDKHNQYYGFIKSDPNNIIFFQSLNRDTNFLKIQNEFVLYDVMTNYDGEQTAINIRPLQS
ncbi:MAG TPA: hypothetical protein VEF53_00975, partial [Patescibacteria group bacterium]|nr:hypothetical protein [Patescibacteria group bacterium]